MPENSIALRHLNLGLLALIILIGVIIRVDIPHPKHSTPDEQTYTLHANRFVIEGFSRSYPSMIGDFLENPDRWIYPSPARLGVTLPIAVVKMFQHGRLDRTGGIYVSKVSSILCLIVLSFFTFRIFGALPALWVSGIYLFNLLDICVAGRVWGDALFGLTFGLLVLGMLHLALNVDISRLSLFLLLLGGGVPIWIKESALPLTIILLLVVVFWRKALFDSLVSGLVVATIGCLSLLLHYSILASLVGGFPALFRIYELVKSTHEANQYILSFQTGPSYKLMEMLVVSMPGLTLCAVIGAILVLKTFMRDSIRWKEDKQLQIALTAAVLFVFEIVLFSLSPGMKNLRYLSAATVPMFVLAAYPIYALEQRMVMLPAERRKLIYGVVITLCVVLLWWDRSKTVNFIYEKKIPDPSLGFLSR